jgi:hypothetical protein
MEDKVAAIYELREAAEQHARIEVAVGEKPKGKDRDLLLDARIELEQKTQQAIESCVYCGRAHTDDGDECGGTSSRSNVIPVDFSRQNGDEKEPPPA